MKKKIAVFQYGWLLSQLGYLVKSLSEEGFHVDVFLHECNMEFYQISDEERIRVHLTDRPGEEAAQPVTARVVARLKSLVKNTWIEPLAIRTRILLRKLTPEFMLPGGMKLIPKTLVDEALRVIADENYVCLIGVEKAGLIWAGLVGERTGLPWMYYSLELLTSDNDVFYDYDLVRYSRAEKLYHQKAVATIIQDQDRADVLLKDNKVKNQKVIFLPVSIVGEVIPKSSDYLRAEYDIPKDTVIVLQFGHIHEWRFCEEVMLEAGDFGEGIVLVMHGKYPEGKEKYSHLISNGRVVLSDKLVPNSELGKLISSADIGLALYRESPVNDSLTGSASEKLALYLQAGVPVIMFDYPSFRQMNDKYQFGVGIRTLKELGPAIETILKNYSYYRENAFEAFVDHYEFRRGFGKVLDFVKSLER